MRPGSVDALNALPQGTILCASLGVGRKPEDLTVSWRKEPDGSWSHWAGGERFLQSTLPYVHPTDTKAMSNLAEWTIHPASPYIIVEDLEFEEACNA